MLITKNRKKGKDTHKKQTICVSKPRPWPNACDVLIKWKWKLLSRVCLWPHGLQHTRSSVHGILQARKLEWIAIAFCRGSSQPRDWTQVSHVSGRLFIVWATGEVLNKEILLSLCLEPRIGVGLAVGPKESVALEINSASLFMAVEVFYFSEKGQKTQEQGFLWGPHRRPEIQEELSTARSLGNSGMAVRKPSYLLWFLVLQGEQSAQWASGWEMEGCRVQRPKDVQEEAGPQEHEGHCFWRSMWSLAGDSRNQS